MTESPLMSTPRTTEDIAELMAQVRDRVARRKASGSPNGRAPTPPHAASAFQEDDVSSALVAQADFNQASTSILVAMGQALEHMGKELASIEGAVNHQSDLEVDDAARIRQLSETLLETVGRLDRVSSQLEAVHFNVRTHSADLEGLATRVQALAEAADELRGTIGELTESGQRLERRVGHELDELRLRLTRAERSQRGLEETLSSRLAEPETAKSEDPSIQASASADAGEPFDYLLFEHYFRGPVEDIKRRQQAYVPIFMGRRNTLDLGSGRGEFVELLTEQGIGITGIDIDEDMVTFCRGRGLRVVHSDLFPHLEGLSDASIDGVACFQVVEHLTPERILRMIALCGAKAEPGAPIVIETVNPICPLAMGNFYLDPSHVRPVPPDMLRFMLQRGPFAVESIRFSALVPGSRRAETLEVTGSLPREAGLYQDYAIIARRR